MMNARTFSYLMMTFAGIGLLVGTGVLASDKSLLSLCQKGCWLNSILYALFGERGGKLAFATVWYLSAALVFFLALNIRKKALRKHSDSD